MKKVLSIFFTAAVILGMGSLAAENRESMAMDSSSIRPMTAINITPSPVYDGDAKHALIDGVTYAYRSEERDERNVQITAIFAPAETRKLVLPDAINGRAVTSLNLLKKDKAVSLEGVTSLTLSAQTIENPRIICKNGDIRAGILVTSLEGYFPVLEEVKVAEGNSYLVTKNGVLYTKDLTYLLYYPKRKKDTEFKEPDTIYMSRGYEKTQYLKKVTFSSNPEYEDTPDCGFSNLETVVIPSNIKSVSWFAFHDCRKLTQVQWHDGIKELDNGAFQGCIALKKLQLPKLLQIISAGAFEKCANLNFGSLKLPDRLRCIGDDAFLGTKCNKVLIPASLECYGKHTFSSSTKIKKPNYIKNVTSKKIKSKYKLDGYFKYGYSYYLDNQAVALVSIKKKKKKHCFPAASVKKIGGAKKKIKLKKGKRTTLNTKVKVERDSGIIVSGQLDAELLKFSSSNSKVVKVTKTGKLQAKKKGSAVIRVSLRVSNDNFHVKGYKVKVKVN